MDLQLSGFASEQFVMVQTVSPPGGGVWKAQAPFLTDNYGCVAIATQAPLAGNDRDMDALGHFWSPFQNRGNLNYRETQQVAPIPECSPSLGASVVRTSDNDQKTTSSNQNIDRPDVLCARGLVAQNRSTRCPIP